MKQEIKHIIIRHLSGGKENQIEEFDYQANDTIRFGRATENDLLFDADQDTMVSRRHGNIAKGDTPGTFTITDNESLNGTYVNGEKITGTRPIRPGDEIMLGAKGPRFIFDTYPSMAGSAATQLVNIPGADATMQYELPQEEVQEAPAKTGIGKETFERAIVGERKRSQKTMISVIGAVVLVLSALGYTFRDKLIPQPQVIQGETSIIDDSFKPEVIVQDNFDKVVFIEFGYKLIHTASGDDVYHHYTKQKDEQSGKEVLIPLYIEVEPGVIEPYLGLKKDVTYGAPIAVSGATGSGFVVDEEGFILTNRHVASNWNAYYTFPREAQKGYLYQNVNGEWKITGWTNAPMRWVPAESKFFGQKPMSGKILEGQVTYMEVTFPKTDQRTPASIVRISNTHDVAMIKIEVPGSLAPVKLKQTPDDDIAPGQKIVVMGYPGISPDVAVAKVSQDFANRRTQVLTVPDPTVTDGTIGKIIRGSNPTENTLVGGYYSMIGEYYQLTASETGAGNSGGPVFDKNGEVIGIFSASYTSQEGARITFAIPIKYGIELMSSQRVIR